MEELRIDEEFKTLIPPLDEEEFRLLEESIIRDGCDTPLTVWNDTIIDGHNRYKICIANDVPFKVVKKEFNSREEVIRWMLVHQLGRRNLNSYQRSELVLMLEPMMRKEAAKRQATSTGGDEPQLKQNSAEAGKRQTRDELAKMAGVSHDTIDKVKRISRDADEDTKEQLRSGKLSIRKAYQSLKQKDEGESEETEKSKGAKSKMEDLGNGMVKVGGVLRHEATGVPDDPEYLEYFEERFESVNREFFLSVESVLKMYGEHMRNDRTNRMMEKLFKKTTGDVQKMIKEKIGG